MPVVTQIIGAVSGLSLAVAFLLFEDAYKPDPIHLEVATAEYLEIEGRGHIKQQIFSVSGKPVPAVWSASITRVDQYGVSTPLCSGTGGPDKPGQYNGAIDIYDLNEWTGDDCRDTVMRPGDIAEATWTYTNEYGVTVTIGTVIKHPGDIENG